MTMNAQPVQPFPAALAAAGYNGPRGRAEFGLAVGVDGVTVWRWITGRSRPSSHATRSAIAESLQCAVEDVEAMFPEEQVPA